MNFTIRAAKHMWYTGMYLILIFVDYRTTVKTKKNCNSQKFLALWYRIAQNFDGGKF